MTILRPNHSQRKSTSPQRLTNATVFVTAPGGVLFSIDPQHADRCAERLARFIPWFKLSHVANGDYWIVMASHAETARWILLTECGTMLRLWAPSYPAALGRLARRGRIAAQGRSGRAA